MANRIERTTALLAWAAGQEPTLAAGLAGMGLMLPRLGCFADAGGLLLARVAPLQALAMRLGADEPLLDELAPLCTGGAAAFIDLSDARVGYQLSGPTARARLAQLVSLDLHPDRFIPGRCAQTMAAHMSVTLLQLAPALFELQGARSLAGSLAQAIDSVPPDERPNAL